MLVIIHHSVNPYRVAFFNALAQAGVKFKVYFLSHPAKNRKWQVSDFKMNFSYQFLNGKKVYVPGNDHSYFQLNTDVWEQLENDQPDQVITIGWNYSAAFIAAWFCKVKKKDFIVWSESTAFETSLQRTLTKPAVNWLLNQTKSCIAAGTRSKEYLEKLGVSGQQIKIAYYTVDTKKFIKQAQTVSETKVAALRKKLGFTSDQVVFLYVGQLIPRKGIHQLIQLAKQLKSEYKIKFLCVGYGELQSWIEEQRLENVTVQSFVPNDQIIQYFKMADVFILPSLEETWGLVVNEAMCAGKPVLVSQYAGCSPDLVKNGRNGYSFDPKNQADFLEKVKRISESKQRRAQMGQKSLEIIRKVNIAQNVQVIKEIIHA